MRKELVDIVTLFHRQNGVATINLPTNGILQPQIVAKTEAILAENPELTVNIGFSLDGLAATHDRVRAVPGCFRKAIASIVICVISGSCGVYYPYFFCYLLLVAGGFAWWNRRSVAPFLAALVLTGVVAGTLVLNHLPTIIYQRTHGYASLVNRCVGDAVFLGL